MVDSPVVDALRNTPKGQQKYDPYWHEDGRMLVSDCSSVNPSL